MNEYKIYNPQDESFVIVSTLAEVADLVGLPTSDIRKVFQPGAHITKSGFSVFTFDND